MDDLHDRLLRRDWRLTTQRRAVVEALRGEHVHLSADEVLARVRDRLPDTSRATVYNTLNELVEMGEIGEINVGRARRYDPNAANRHHHLLCDVCGSLRDVRLDEEPAAPEGIGGFRLTRTEVLFAGVCGDCLER